MGRYHFLLWMKSLTVVVRFEEIKLGRLSEDAIPGPHQAYNQKLILEPSPRFQMVLSETKSTYDLQLLHIEDNM